MSIKTYTLFLPGITNDDLDPGDNEFDSVQEFEDYEHSSMLMERCDVDGADDVGVTDDVEDTDEADDTDSTSDSSESNNTDFEIPDIEPLTKDDYTVFSGDSYEEVPAYYSGISTWIKSTNILCISCSNKIQGMPMFIPLSWHTRVVAKDCDASQEDSSDELDPLNGMKSGEAQVEQKVMKVHFLTCNERCAKRYIVRVKDSKITNKWQSLQLLQILAEEVRGKKIVDIEEGLDKCIMMQYCGPNGVSAQKFREMNSVK
jgi:hypothetical protein